MPNAMADANRRGAARIIVPLADWMARRSRFLAAIALVSVALPAWWLRRLEIDNSIETWLLRKSPEYRQYEAFLEKFGSEEYIIVAATVDDPFSPSSLARQRRLAKRFEGIEGVGGILSLPQFAHAVWPRRDDWPDEARRTPFLRNLLLGTDTNTVGVLAWFRRSKDPADRNRTVEAIEAAVRQEAGPDFQPHLAGTPLVNVALNRSCAENIVMFVPLALAVSVAVLALMLRNLARIVAPLLAVVSAVTWTMGLMALAGVPLNMVTVALPPLLLVLVLSNGIHLASRFADHLAALGDREAAVRQTLRELIRPAFLTSFTTSVGFGSLVVSEMEPLADAAKLAAAGLMFGLVFNLLVVPGVLSALQRSAAPRGPSLMHHWTSRTGAAISRSWWIVVPVALVATGLGALAISRIVVQSHVLKFLPKDSLVTRDYTWINDRLTGFYTIEIEARTAPEHEDQVLDAMDRLTAALAARRDVSRTIHMGQIVPFIERVLLIGRLEGTDPETERFLADVRQRFRQRADGQVALRLSVIVREHEGIVVTDLVDVTVREARETLPASAAVGITGIVPLLKQSETALIRTQIRSFALAAGISLVLIGVLYRSWRAFLASILPNVVPIVGTFALMALRGIPLDVATVMVASVAIGIAVDDTIHFLACYQDARREGKDAAASTAAAFTKAGRAMVFTSVVAAAGFGMLSLSSFRPLADFGVLTGIAMLTALAGDLFVLPATARLVNLWGKPKAP